MASERPQHPFERGPYIQAASFCDQVIEGKDGVLSLIRVVDRLNVEAKGPSAPETMPPHTASMTLVLMLKSGDAVGRHEIRIVPQLPSGETKTPLVLTAHLEPGRGQNLLTKVEMTLNLEGQHWFNVFFDDIPLTKVPMEVRYTRVVTPKSTQG